MFFQNNAIEVYSIIVGSNNNIMKSMQYQSAGFHKFVEITGINFSVIVMQNCYFLLNQFFKKRFFSKIIILPPLFKGVTVSSLAQK